MKQTLKKLTILLIAGVLGLGSIAFAHSGSVRDSLDHEERVSLEREESFGR